MFDEGEQRVYQFVTQHLGRYGGLPGVELLRENGIMLPPATGTVDYHLQRLADRTVYNSYATRQQALNQAFLGNNIAEARRLFEEIYTTIRSTDVHNDTFEMPEAIEQAWEEYRVASTQPGLQGMSYGWDFLDDLTGGLRNGDVATIVARPGLGKSFTITKAAITAWRQGASVAFVSMEMTAVETARRVLAMETGINPDFLLRGRLSQWGEELAEHTMERLRGRPPFTMLVGDLSKSVSDVDALIQERAPDFVCVDASYLLNPSDRSYKGKKWEAMAAVAQDIKGLALRRNKPILQTVQFNRSSAPDEEMDLSQIGGTDVVGQVSALVLGMRRGAAPYERSRRRYLVLKNRHGQDHVNFETRFEFSPFNMDRIDPEEPVDPAADWNGQIGEQPAATEWSNA
jgi:replicative DNA helicase